jgi:hypothetical protein
MSARCHRWFTGILALLALCAASLCVANSPPKADAGPGQSVLVGALVQLDGSRSSDRDGPFHLAYSWRFTRRPAASNAVLSDRSAVRPTFVVDKAGDYAIELTVFDGVDVSRSSAVMVSTRNSPPVANAGPDQTVFAGDTVIVDASASTDVDGDTLDYTWAIVSRPAGSTAALTPLTSGRASFVVDKEGAYTLMVVVSDRYPILSSDIVAVSTSNSRPVANPKASCAPAPNVGCSGTIASTITLDGSASTDVDGDP